MTEASDRSTPSVAVVVAAGASRICAPGAAAPAQEAATVASAWSSARPGSMPFKETRSGEAGNAKAERKAATLALLTLLRDTMAMVWPAPLTPRAVSGVMLRSCAARCGVNAEALTGEVSDARSAAETVRGCGAVSTRAERTPSSETRPAMTGDRAPGTVMLAVSTARVLP